METTIYARHYQTAQRKPRNLFRDLPAGGEVCTRQEAGKWGRHCTSFSGSGLRLTGSLRVPASEGLSLLRFVLNKDINK